MAEAKEKGRIYIVADSESGDERLVDAGNPAQAIRHAARGRYMAKPAGQRDLARLMAAGIKVEKAGDEPDAKAGA